MWNAGIIHVCDFGPDYKHKDKQILRFKLPRILLEIIFGYECVYKSMLKVVFKGFYVKVGNGCTIVFEYDHMFHWVIDIVQMFEFKVIVMPTHQQRPILIFALYIYIYIYPYKHF